MKKLTDTFGEHFEYLGEFGQTDPRIIKNPMFGKSIHANSMVPTSLTIADFLTTISITMNDNFSNEYDEVFGDGDREIYLKDGQPILIVSPTSVIFLTEVKNNLENTIQSLEYTVDSFGNLHIKNSFASILFPMLDSRDKHQDFEIVSHIFDKHGIELQQDHILANLPKNVQRKLTALKDDRKKYVRTIQKCLLEYPFYCRLGRLARYKQSDGTYYDALQRSTSDLLHCCQYDGRHKCTEYPLYLDHGITLITSRGCECNSLAVLVNAITQEENEETRNALIAYCADRGVTKELVSGLGKDKK